jgi:hypothetical protein
MADVTAAHDLITIAWPVAAAIGTASLSVIGKVIFDVYSRVSDRRAERRAIAATLAGETGGYLLALNPEIAAKNYRALADLDRAARLRKLAAFPPLPTGHPAYDKLADKVGLLPPHLTREISRIYNVVTGVRLLIMHFRTTEFLAADDDYQQGLIRQVAVAMDTHVPAARTAIEELEAIASLPTLGSSQPAISKLGMP